jgi:hypothetical protein
VPHLAGSHHAGEVLHIARRLHGENLDAGLLGFCEQEGLEGMMEISIYIGRLG